MKKYEFLENYKHIHFVGIGGICMSALAKICFSSGIFISGSDRTSTSITDELEHIGIKICIGHNKKNVKDADLIVYTCAVSQNNPEILHAKKLGIKIMERAEFLGELSKQFEEVIAVAGSHGKTTVCAMIAQIFLTAKKNPTIIVGGEVLGIGNLVVGGQKYLIVEACEYMEHFLKLKRTTSVVLNVDYDHPDFFKSSSEYLNAFEKFCEGAKNIVTSEQCKILTDKKTITFGKFGKFCAKNIHIKAGNTSFDVFKHNEFFVHIELKSYSSYNIQNALCAIAVADLYDILPSYIADGLSKFEGVHRRFEFMGKLCSNVVITDYAHHPTQIKDCILATKRAYKRPVVAVFEPHTYSRTKSLFSDFVDSLFVADQVILLPTYSAREHFIRGGSSKDLYYALKFSKDNVFYRSSYKSCKKFLSKFQNSVILLLGAGSIINLANDIKQAYISTKTKDAD